MKNSLSNYLNIKLIVNDIDTLDKKLNPKSLGNNDSIILVSILIISNHHN